MQKKRRPINLVPRLGPPTNIRPAGAHEDKRREKRATVKAALRRAEAAFELTRSRALASV